MSRGEDRVQLQNSQFTYCDTAALAAALALSYVQLTPCRHRSTVPSAYAAAERSCQTCIQRTNATVDKWMLSHC